MSDPFRIRAQDGQPRTVVTGIDFGAGNDETALVEHRPDGSVVEVKVPSCPCDCSCHRNDVFPERFCGEPVFPGDAERQAGQPGQVICGWCLDVCEAIVDG